MHVHNMASRHSLCCLIGVLMFPVIKTYEKTEQPILHGRSLGDQNLQIVECSLRTSDSFAGMTLYDVMRERDVYVSVNSKNECKTKHLLGGCEFNESWMFLKAVISNLTRGEIRTFACNSTWLDPEHSQGHVLMNMSYIAGESQVKVSSKWTIAAPIIISVLLVATLAGWVAFFLMLRHARIRYRDRGNSAEIDDIIKSEIETELRQKGIPGPRPHPKSSSAYQVNLHT